MCREQWWSTWPINWACLTRRWSRTTPSGSRRRMSIRFRLRDNENSQTHELNQTLAAGVREAEIELVSGHV